jgi:hypothetical protein
MLQHGQHEHVWTGGNGCGPMGLHGTVPSDGNDLKKIKPIQLILNDFKLFKLQPTKN